MLFLYSAEFILLEKFIVLVKGNFSERLDFESNLRY